MILRNKRDNEAFVREQTLETMKANTFLQNNDIVLVADGTEAYTFYKILDTTSDPNKITLNNNKFAVLIKDPKRYTKEEADKNFTNINTSVNVGPGLTGGGNLANNININLDPLTEEEIKQILNFEEIKGNFILANETDIRNLFYNVKGIIDFSYKLGAIDTDQTKLVNMKLLSIFNDLNLQKNKEYNTELKNTITSETDSKISNLNSTLTTNINKKLDSTVFEEFKTSNTAQIDSKANKNTSVNVGPGLTGGGDLTANRTINVDFANSTDIDKVIKETPLGAELYNKIISLEILNILATSLQSSIKAIKKDLENKADNTTILKKIEDLTTNLSSISTTLQNKANDTITVSGTGALTGGGDLKNNREISHKDAPGFKHIPSGGALNQYLKYLQDGTAQWKTISVNDVTDIPTVNIGNGLTGGGKLTQNININLDFLTKAEIDQLLSKYKKGV